MKQFVFIIAILSLVFGLGLALTSLWAYVDPYCMPLLSDTARTGAAPSRGEITSVLVFSAAVAAVATRVLWSLRCRNDADATISRDTDNSDGHDPT